MSIIPHIGMYSHNNLTLPTVEYAGVLGSTSGSLTLGDEAGGRRIVVCQVDREVDASSNYLTGGTIGGFSVNLAYAVAQSDPIGVFWAFAPSGTGSITCSATMASGDWANLRAYILRNVDTLVDNLTIGGTGGFGPIVVERPSVIVAAERSRSSRPSTSLDFEFSSNFLSSNVDVSYNSGGGGNRSIGMAHAITKQFAYAGDIGDATMESSSTDLDGCALVFQ